MHIVNNHARVSKIDLPVKSTFYELFEIFMCVNWVYFKVSRYLKDLSNVTECGKYGQTKVCWSCLLITMVPVITVNLLVL